MEELERKYQHMKRASRNDSGSGYEYEPGPATRDFEMSADNDWKDRVIIVVGIVVSNNVDRRLMYPADDWVVTRCGFIFRNYVLLGR